MLLLEDTQLEQRRAAARGPLEGLYRSLVDELEPLLARELYVPNEKALLSRAGGRCERDGTQLEFDPFEPHKHRCGSCRAEYSGELHHRAWITWYQLWLAERAVHAALFHALGGEERHAQLARSILRALAERYLSYPNRDNVLGPTRPFFSTYLESIWLLQVCVAADLLEHGGDHATAELARDRIVEPSRALIAQFDEGMSNRQVWNNAALLAASLACGDSARAEEVLHAASGPATHLTRAVLPDGTWFEGDNYHQFAVRGLWYVGAMCEARGLPLAEKAGAALDRAIVATFLTALPDFTLPSRKDSQYAVSLRQWRYAELAELGYARRPNVVLADALARCYDRNGDRGDSGRAISTADAERNRPATLLTRADLGWRALLHALPELPAVRRAAPASAHLASQGLAIFRRPDDVYIALDYGQSGAGHGHPDRLNLLLSQGATRWLDDLGTGSYVDRSLHWYRSTLAHNAPLVEGKSQPGQGGRLRAHAEAENAGWIEASTRDGDVTLTRTIVAMADYLVDELVWSAPHEVRVELPWHLDAKADGLAFEAATVEGAGGLEDGFDFARQWTSTRVASGVPVRLLAAANAERLQATIACDREATVYRAEGPGQPPSTWRPFYMVGARGKAGRFRAVVSWVGPLDVTFGEGVTVRRGAREEHEHQRVRNGWRIEVRKGGGGGGGGTRRVELAGRAAEETPTSAQRVPPPLKLRRHSDPIEGWWSDQDDGVRGKMLVRELGEANYRRSEETWREAGQPRATVAFAAHATGLVVFVDVNAWEQRFVPPGTANDLDNEAADTMGAGVQLYVTSSGERGAWMLVPEGHGERVRVRPIAGSTSRLEPRARWEQRGDGYELRIDLDVTASAVDFDLVINEAPSSRVRRRGQLVLHDARGEFVYLRGDREDAANALRLELT